MKKNKYIIRYCRKFWFWFWMNLMNGFAPSDKEGNYKRPKGIAINKAYLTSSITLKDCYLLVGETCPWSHRLLILHRLKNLSCIVPIVYLLADHKSGQWIFKEKFAQVHTLSDLYKLSMPKYQLRPTVPLLVNLENKTCRIIANESDEIAQLLNSSFESKNNTSFSIKESPKILKNLINTNINDGVYKCGFARNQKSYLNAINNLFDGLEYLEKAFQEHKGPWICGEELTIADIYLFPTLIRWELIYSKLFKCTKKDLQEFPNIIQWRIRFFNLPGISETCSESVWTNDYFKALFPLNPNQIVPIQPSLKEILSKK